MPEIPEPRPAADKRQARAQRIHDLRMRVVAIAVALFVAAWVGLYIQLVSGNDPALAGTLTPTAQSADPAATTDDSSDDGWSNSDSGDGWSDDDGSDDGWADGTSDGGWGDDGTSGTTTPSPSSSTPAPVTSGQS